MEIAVIGTGSVGGALGSRLSRRHRIVYGTREPDTDRHGLLDTTPGVRLAAPAVAVAVAEVVVLAVPWGAARAAVAGLGTLRERVVIDATNPIADGGLDPQAAPSGLAVLVRHATGGRFGTAFNTVCANVMADPSFPVRATMPVAGEDGAARRVALTLAEELGFAPLDVGGADVAASVEHLAWLWIHLAMRRGHGREIAWLPARR